MSVDGLSGLVNRIIAWADRLQRERGVLGFPYAVIKKYGDDAGGRQAALITYYGFLSIFPLLLLGVAVLSRVLADHPGLRQRLIAEIVPQALRPTVEHSLATLPTSTIPLVAGLIGLLLSGTGVVFSAYQTLNHVAAVRHRFRAGFLSRYVRVFAVLATLMAGALATGALTVVATARPASRRCSGRPRCSGRRWSSSRCCCSAPSCCSPGPRRSGRCGREPSWAQQRWWWCSTPGRRCWPGW